MVLRLLTEAAPAPDDVLVVTRRGVWIASLGGEGLRGAPKPEKAAGPEKAAWPEKAAGPGPSVRWCPAGPSRPASSGGCLPELRFDVPACDGSARFAASDRMFVVAGGTPGAGPVLVWGGTSGSSVRGRRSPSPAVRSRPFFPVRALFCHGTAVVAEVVADAGGYAVLLGLVGGELVVRGERTLGPNDRVVGIGAEGRPYVVREGGVYAAHYHGWRHLADLEDASEALGPVSVTEWPSGTVTIASAARLLRIARDGTTCRFDLVTGTPSGFSDRLVAHVSDEGSAIVARTPCSRYDVPVPGRVGGIAVSGARVLASVSADDGKTYDCLEMVVISGRGGGYRARPFGTAWRRSPPDLSVRPHPSGFLVEARADDADVPGRLYFLGPRP